MIIKVKFVIFLPITFNVSDKLMKFVPLKSMQRLAVMGEGEDSSLYSDESRTDTGLDCISVAFISAML